MADLGYHVEYVTKLSEANDYDCLIFVGNNLDAKAYPSDYKEYVDHMEEQAEHDNAIRSHANALYYKKKINLAVYTPTGKLDRDYDDVRRYEDAVKKGVSRALSAGKKAPLLVVSSNHSSSPRYKEAPLVSLLAAFEAVYVPLEVREHVSGKKRKVSKVGITCNQFSGEEGANMVEIAAGIEAGRIIARDIGGSDPERMSAPNTEKYIKKVFEGSNIKISVQSGQKNLEKSHPLFAAVNRCTSGIERHDGRVIYMEYVSGKVDQTFLFVGKGVTYDTGGADVKYGGHMAGMHRDKCGAATVAGLFGVLARLKPDNIKVVGRMAMVRNSIGANCYVADEIITSAAGVRVRVGNTDAEGRMAMSDPLHYSKLQALKEVNPHIMTIATLTGHAIRAVGEAYTIVLDNGPAAKNKFAQKISAVGDEIADPFEISTLRREDYEFVDGRNEYEDVLQCNNAPSSSTPRGHQFPAAFMITAAGLSKHGIDSDHPLQYTHMDIAGSSGPFPGIPTGTPIVALAKYLKVFTYNDKEKSYTMKNE